MGAVRGVLGWTRTCERGSAARRRSSQEEDTRSAILCRTAQMPSCRRPLLVAPEANRPLHGGRGHRVV